jgi:hypothetical protein
MTLQAFALGIGLVLVALTPQHLVTVGMCVALIAWWRLLRRRYMRRRQTRARETLDRTVAWQVVITAGLPLATAVVMELSDTVAFGESTPISVGVAALASLWLATYASCLVDWYYILPRRDGIVVEPPCRPSDVDWTNVTRAWYTHRALASVVGAAAVVVATTAFTFAAFGGPHFKDLDKAGSLVLTSAATGLVLTRLLYGNLTTIGDVVSGCCLSKPDIALGDHLKGPKDFLGGYVLDVALEGIAVVRLDDDGNLIGDTPRSKRHGIVHVLDRPELEGEPFSPCRRECQLLNMQCQRHLWKKRTVPLAPARRKLLGGRPS